MGTESRTFGFCILALGAGRKCSITLLLVSILRSSHGQLRTLIFRTRHREHDKTLLWHSAITFCFGREAPLEGIGNERSSATGAGIDDVLEMENHDSQWKCPVAAKSVNM